MNESPQSVRLPKSLGCLQVLSKLRDLRILIAETAELSTGYLRESLGRSAMEDRNIDTWGTNEQVLAARTSQMEQLDVLDVPTLSKFCAC